MQAKFADILPLFNFLVEQNTTSEEIKLLLQEFPVIFKNFRESQKKFIGDFEIIRTGTIPKTDEVFLGKNVESYFGVIKDKVEAEGNKFFINNYIKDILDPVEIHGHEETDYTSYRLGKQMNIQEIQDIGTKNGIYVVDNAFVAIKKTIDMFLNGDNQRKVTSVFSYFFVGTTLCRISIYRHTDDSIELFLNNTYSKKDWNFRYVVGFSKKKP